MKRTKAESRVLSALASLSWSSAETIGAAVWGVGERNPRGYAGVASRVLFALFRKGAVQRRLGESGIEWRALHGEAQEDKAVAIIEKPEGCAAPWHKVDPGSSGWAEWYELPVNPAVTLFARRENAEDACWNYGINGVGVGRAFCGTKEVGGDVVPTAGPIHTVEQGILRQASRHLSTALNVALHYLE